MNNIKCAMPADLKEKEKIHSSNVSIDEDSIYGILSKIRYNLLYALSSKELLNVKLHQGRELPEFNDPELFPNYSLFDIAFILRDLSDQLAADLNELVSRI